MKKIDDIHSDCGASEPYALQVTDDNASRICS